MDRPKNREAPTSPAAAGVGSCHWVGATEGNSDSQESEASHEDVKAGEVQPADGSGLSVGESSGASKSSFTFVAVTLGVTVLDVPFSAGLYKNEKKQFLSIPLQGSWTERQVCTAFAKSICWLIMRELPYDEKRGDGG